MRYVSHWPLGVPLLFLAVYLPGGTLRKLGSRKLFAYTQRKVLGMRTPATATTAGCSFYSLRGAESEGIRDRIALRLASSFTGHGLSGSATADRGASGELRERAV